MKLIIFSQVKIHGQYNYKYWDPGIICKTSEQLTVLFAKKINKKKGEEP